MSDRLTRKDIKRNELVEGLDRVIEFFQENARKLAMAGAGLLVLVIAFVALSAARSAKAEKANQLLADVLEVVNAPVGEAAGDAELSFASREAQEARAAELVAEMKGVGAGPSDVASVFLGDFAANSGDLEGARTHWEELLRKDSSSLLAATVQSNLLALDRSQGRSEEALSRLEGWLDGGASALPKDALLRELAATYEDLGRADEAQQTYQRLVDEHPTSAYASEVRAKIES